MKCRYTYQPDIESTPANMPMTRRTAIAAIATLPVLETQARPNNQALDRGIRRAF
jgi:hypothetical protein